MIEERHHVQEADRAAEGSARRGADRAPARALDRQGHARHARGHARAAGGDAHHAPDRRRAHRAAPQVPRSRHEQRAADRGPRGRRTTRRRGRERRDAPHDPPAPEGADRAARGRAARDALRAQVPGARGRGRPAERGQARPLRRRPALRRGAQDAGFEVFASYRVKGAMRNLVKAETRQARIVKEIDRAFYNRMAEYGDDYDILRHDRAGVPAPARRDVPARARRHDVRGRRAGAPGGRAGPRGRDRVRGDPRHAPRPRPRARAGGAASARSRLRPRLQPGRGGRRDGRRPQDERAEASNG